MSAWRFGSTTRRRAGCAGARGRPVRRWGWCGTTRCPGCSSGASDDSQMTGHDARLVRNTAFAIQALVALRLVAAAGPPLTFDEAYYWMWSKHLAFGYYDHPPMVALVIRAGTLIAGDTELGVRLVSFLSALR